MEILRIVVRVYVGFIDLEWNGHEECSERKYQNQQNQYGDRVHFMIVVWPI